jgi:two-component system, cell cycle sensor histidine kinase and response regulator CckA
VGRLAGGVAHDFNNILTAIYGYSDVLLGALPPGAEAHGFVTEIRKAAARAASLTQQLLAFSRRQSLVPGTLNLNELLEGLRPMLARLIGEDVEVAFDLAGDLWTVRADRARLEQALLNLAVNGRDAMPKGGTLTVRTRNAEADTPSPGERTPGSGQRVMVTVSDTGVGMDSQTQSHLFEPFFTTKDVGKGTGLGLATVYGIVNQSGGSITFRSEPGKGTTFILSLPRSLPDAPAPKEAAPAPAPAAGHEGILYVEDDEAVRTLVTLILQRQGYEVLPAADGVEALRIAERDIQRVSLVIADVVMPRMNGREVVDRLRAMRSGLKFAFTSGYTNDIIERHDVLESGAAFIEKPIEAAALLEKVRLALES